MEYELISISQSSQLLERTSRNIEKTRFLAYFDDFFDGDKKDSSNTKSLFILLRFKSMEEWTYRSRVNLGLVCPSISERDFISNPTSAHLVAKVCRST